MALHTRRRFLEIAGLVGGGVLLRRAWLPEAQAQTVPAEPRFLLMVYFSGGWDQLLAFDPRDATLPAHQYVAGKAPTGGVYPAYGEAAGRNAAVDAVMQATGGKGVQSAGGLTFGPAVPQSLLAHAADLSIVRGMMMDTLTHEVGRRYLLTGKFPRGLAAAGSSLNTVVAAQSQSALELPNLVINMEAYNAGAPASASPVFVRNAADVRAVLNPQSPNALKGSSEAVLAEFEQLSAECGAVELDGDGLATSFRDSRGQARKIVSSQAGALFQFTATPPPEVASLFTAFNLDPARELNSVKARAALAAQALTRGVSQVVSVTLADGLDDHFDLAGQHAASLTPGFHALGLLISYLQSKEVGTSGKSYWDCTTLLGFSEFSRTPLLNARDGRDHHLTGSCLVAGPGLKRGKVYGASSAVGMQVQPVNLSTGALDNAGQVIRPCDLHATLLKSMGMDGSHLSNQSPRLLTGLLR
ncbi:MAG: hypothetical protein RL653_1727 [Pseudomonadota bacterium]|jgi:uncharacterized protein (DUF1501 family)